MIKSIINKIRRKLKHNALVKRATCKDDTVIFSTSASIKLRFGSCPSDVLLGSDVRIKGELISEYGGKISMGDHSSIGPRSNIYSVESVIIGDYATISRYVSISDNNNHPVNPEDRKIIWATPDGSPERSWKYAAHKPIIIGDNCWIGEYSRICKGVTIGEGSIVAANAVVTRDVPPNCIVAGNPAKIVKENIDNTPRLFG